MSEPLEDLWTYLERAESASRRLMNKALAANWFDAEFSSEFGREARARINIEAARLREKIEAPRDTL